MKKGDVIKTEKPVKMAFNGLEFDNFIVDEQKGKTVYHAAHYDDRLRRWHYTGNYTLREVPSIWGVIGRVR